MTFGALALAPGIATGAPLQSKRVAVAAAPLRDRPGRAVTRCASVGHTVTANRQVRVLWQKRRVATYPGEHQTARVYFACARAGGPLRRLRFPHGTAMVAADYEDLLDVRLQRRYLVLVVAYIDAQNSHLAEWRIGRSGTRNVYYTDLGEVYGTEPADLELTRQGGLAWLTNALYKRDEDGFARLGTPDLDEMLCGGEDWCAATVSRRGEKISWREGGFARSYVLRGPAGRRP